MRELQDMLKEAVWVAHSLFNRGKTTGTTANMSFRHEDTVYLSASGSCFGTMTENDFVPVSLDGTPVNTGKGLFVKRATKEAPLHLALYKKSDDIKAVIHTHSTYSVLWSFVPSENESDCIPHNTPYLSMTVGTVGLIPYEKPGTAELFAAFAERVHLSDGYILKNHGPVVGGKSLMNAFSCIEELEESARIAWELHKQGLDTKA